MERPTSAHLWTSAWTWLALALVLLSGCGGGDMPAAAAPPEPSPAPKVDVGSSSTGADVEASFRGESLAPPAAAPAGGAGNFAASPAPPPAPPPPPPAQAPAKTPAETTPKAVAGDAASVRIPMLVYTAHVTMAVFEVNTSLARVEEIGRELGGFLAKRDDRSISIRVPVARFDEAVRRIEGVGDMLHRNIAAEDVTEEFRDLEVRLRSAHAVQQRLTELLSKAVKVEESIAIERELDRVSGEIERIEGRIKFLRDRAAFSTITVSFEPKPQEQVGAKEIRLPVKWLYDLGLRRLLSL